MRDHAQTRLSLNQLAAICKRTVAVNGMIHNSSDVHRNTRHLKSIGDHGFLEFGYGIPSQTHHQCMILVANLKLMCRQMNLAQRQWQLLLGLNLNKPLPILVANVWHCQNDRRRQMCRQNHNAVLCRWGELTKHSSEVIDQARRLYLIYLLAKSGMSLRTELSSPPTLPVGAGNGLIPIHIQDDRLASFFSFQGHRIACSGVFTCSNKFGPRAHPNRCMSRR